MLWCIFLPRQNNPNSSAPNWIYSFIGLVHIGNCTLANNLQMLQQIFNASINLWKFFLVLCAFIIKNMWYSVISNLQI